MLYICTLDKVVCLSFSKSVTICYVGKTFVMFEISTGLGFCQLFVV